MKSQVPNMYEQLFSENSLTVETKLYQKSQRVKGVNVFIKTIILEASSPATNTAARGDKCFSKIIFFRRLD